MPCTSSESPYSNDLSHLSPDQRNAGILFIGRPKGDDVFILKAKEEFVNTMSLKIFPSSQFEDYEFVRSLGHGSYGEVVAAQNIRNGKMFAVKIINKRKMNKEIQFRHLLSEIRILNAIKFEFTISLECYFTTNCNIFIVMPYVGGGQFYRLLKTVKKLDENCAKFFAGQVVLALEYLHYMGVVFRDLKPENLLLDWQGYLKLVDYGFSKNIGNNYTYTFCGTPEYLAPEILLSKGYCRSPDWWTFGILLYEMCQGSPPFTSGNELKLYEKILICDITWPEHFSNELKSLVQGLLQVDRTKRLGCMRNKIEDIKFHAWFHSLDWIALWNKKIIPPISYNGSKYEKVKDFSLGGKFSFIKANNCFPPDFIGNIDQVI